MKPVHEYFMLNSRSACQVDYRFKHTRSLYKTSILVLLIAALLLSVSVVARRRVAKKWYGAPVAVCKRCYEQKATLYMHCVVSPHLRFYNREYCRRLRLQLSVLSKSAPQCDAMIKKYPQDTFMLPLNYAPYDDCDACYNNTHMVAFMCFLSKIYNQNDCEKAQACVFQLHKAYSYYPFIINETVDASHEAS